MSDMQNYNEIPKRLAMYIRVSSESQAKSAKTQTDEITKYLASRGWPPPVLVYEDHMTARLDPRKDPRPQHNKMKLDAMTHQFDTLICWRLDRLARSPKNAAEWLEIAKEGNIRLVFVADNLTVDHSPMGTMVFHIMAAMAKFFADIQQQNREAGQARARREGRSLGGRQRKFRNRKDIVAFYQKGASYAETMEEFGIGRSQLGVILRQEGARRRPWPQAGAVSEAVAEALQPLSAVEND